MKVILCTLLMFIPSTTSILAAAWLSYHDKTGWGWFIFTAILTYGGSIKFSDDKTDNSDDAN